MAFFSVNENFKFFQLFINDWIIANLEKTFANLDGVRHVFFNN